ncbi:MAG: hypothetical protein MI757_15815, partial [Pirellulales bacterium]|nr:hypothetical protein [Pirellulales bacterium]
MYSQPSNADPLSQGDILDGCPLIFWDCNSVDDEIIRKPKEIDARVVVLTQSCDLANRKSTRVQVALLHETETLVSEQVLKAKTIRDNVRLFKVFGWYFLEESEYLPESIVDFRDIHTVSRTLIEDLVNKGRRRCTLDSPYREHMSKH